MEHGRTLSAIHAVIVFELSNASFALFVLSVLRKTGCLSPSEEWPRDLASTCTRIFRQTCTSLKPAFISRTPERYPSLASSRSPLVFAHPSWDGSFTQRAMFRLLSESASLSFVRSKPAHESHAHVMGRDRRLHSNLFESNCESECVAFVHERQC